MSTPQFKPETLASLFESAVTYSVPPYQRAFSWEGKQIDQFLEDLKDQRPTKSYYLGHFLFERNSDNELFVIDGQQRLSTIVLFLGAAARILDSRLRVNEAEDIRNRYIERDRQFRFSTVGSDLDLFMDLAKFGSSTTTVSSRSQKRIHEGYGRIFKALEKLDDQEILDQIAIAGSADITRLVVRDKIQATQIFTLQNSRGKTLTDLEKLKAFLMYEVYLNSPNEKENREIKSMEGQFKIIYDAAENIHHLNEDQVLHHHDQAYSARWDGPVENLKCDLRLINCSDSKVSHITEYCKSLASTFQHVVKLERLSENHTEIGDLLILDAPNSWPLLIKLYGIYGEGVVQDRQLVDILRDTEVTLLKFHFLHGRSSNDLIQYAKGFGNGGIGIDWLAARMKETSAHGFRPNGNFNEPFLNFLNWDNHYHRITRYVLWKYENKIRQAKDDKVSPGDFLGQVAKKGMDSTIEHVEPVTSQGGAPHEPEFANKYLHNLGNFLFMPRGLNASLSNRPALEKAAILKDLSYKSHRKVADLIFEACHTEGCSEAWCCHKILKRKQDIINFAVTQWRAN